MIETETVEIQTVIKAHKQKNKSKAAKTKTQLKIKEKNALVVEEYWGPKTKTWNEHQNFDMCKDYAHTKKNKSKKKLKWIVNHYGMSRIPTQQFGARGGVGTCLKKLGPIIANKMLTEGIFEVLFWFFLSQ